MFNLQFPEERNRYELIMEDQVFAWPLSAPVPHYEQRLKSMKFKKLMNEL